MSICPDTSLYSAYVDGEVPSPWKEKLEEHLASCEKCRAVESRYRTLRGAMRQLDMREPVATEEFLASSFKKLSPRWEIAAEKAIAERASLHPAAGRKHTAVHYFALAAMFLVAASVPAFFVARAMQARGPEMSPVQAIRVPDEGMVLAGAQGSGFAPPPPADETVFVTLGDAQAGRDFTLINQARMFAQDKEAFSAPGNGYVIIRLPEMVRFKAEPPESEPDSSERARGFPPLQDIERRRGESGYIINVGQR